MLDKFDTLVEVCRNKGVVAGIVVSTKYISPSPIDKRISIAQKILSESPDGFCRTTQFESWRNGFSPKSYLLYDFEEYRPCDYLSDLDEKFCWDINKPYSEYLNDKQRFYAVLDNAGFGNHLPQKLYHIGERNLDNIYKDLIILLEQEKKLVIKDAKGAAGENVYICENAGSGISINGTTLTESEFLDLISDSDEYLVTEYCQQADYINEIYPKTPNTIRVLTMNPHEGDPFVARAVHRIGSETSDAVDNFSQGGLSAKINENGKMGPAVRYDEGVVTWHDKHPDTGIPIRGKQVPSYSKIRKTVLSIVRAIPEMRYVGWDVIVTEGEFKIIEANSNSDTDLLQAHGPLLTDEKVRAFYEEHDIV